MVMTQNGKMKLKQKREGEIRQACSAETEKMVQWIRQKMWTKNQKGKCPPITIAFYKGFDMAVNGDNPYDVGFRYDLRNFLVEFGNDRERARKILFEELGYAIRRAGLWTKVEEDVELWCNKAEWICTITKLPIVE